METYFICLSGWSLFTKVSSILIKRKHLTYVAMFHTSTCIYLLSNDRDELAITNTLAYFTCDFMQILFTNYYNRQNTLIFSFHHIMSMVTLTTIKKDNIMYPLMLKVFRDIELSNVALNIFYVVSKLTKCKEVLAVANGMEALGYGYYRVGLLKHGVQELWKNDSITNKLLFGTMYSFGVFFTGALICTTFNRVSNLF